MGISPKTTGVHHIALRSSNMQTSKNFYQNILGLPLVLDTETLIGFMAGSVFIGIKQASPPHAEDTVFTPFNIGLDHVAMACESLVELERVAKELSEAGVENTGVKVDATLQKKYVAFKDPDRIQWEFYMM